MKLCVCLSSSINTTFPTHSENLKSVEHLGDVCVGGKTEICVKEIRWVVSAVQLAYVKVHWRVLWMRWVIDHLNDYHFLKNYSDPWS